MAKRHQALIEFEVSGNVHLYCPTISFMSDSRVYCHKTLQYKFFFTPRKTTNQKTIQYIQCFDSITLKYEYETQYSSVL